MSLNKAFAYHQHPPSGFGLMDAAYAIPCAQRWPTFKAALTIAGQRCGERMLIVETGCQREPEDWGGGCSTTIFGDYVSRFGGLLFTIDNSAEHLARCRKLTVLHQRDIEYVEYDSVAWLAGSSFLAPQRAPADLLYLDSFDYPYGKLLDIYGGKADLDKAVAAVAELPEAEIVERFGYIIRESQEHCLREVEAAAKSGALGDRTVLLIDDNSIPGGGKPRLAKEWLIANGWTLVLEAYQTLWVRM